MHVLLERVAVNDVVRSVLPMLRAATERHGIRLQVTLDPRLPRVTADRTRLAEALALLGADCARELDVDTESAPAELPPMEVVTRVLGDSVEIRLTRPVAASRPPSTDSLLAERLLEVQGGRLERLPEGVRVLLRPSERQVHAEAT